MFCIHLVCISIVISCTYKSNLLTITMNTLKELPPIELIELLYDYCDGHLIRKLPMGKHKPGSIVECNLNRVYAHIIILGIEYKLHRVIWKLVHKEEPPEMIDHINRCPRDNRIENLRTTNSRDNYINSDRYEQVALPPEAGRRARRMRVGDLLRLREQLGMAC